jgi:hypothetical protein
LLLSLNLWLLHCAILEVDKMNIDLTSLFPDLEALTPEGRWNMLQKWLKENPEYGERAERWSTQTVGQVYAELFALVTEKHGAFAATAFAIPSIAAKIKSTIEVLQACYRERAREWKAEYTSGWMELENDQRPSAHKSIHDYQQQLKAKKRRRKK